MQRNIHLLVGFFVLIGLLALVFLSLRVSNLTEFNQGSTYRVRAYFDDIGGLKPRAAVRSAGVLVGRVTQIGFDDQRYQAEVVLELQSQVRFPKDSSAQILTAGLLGEKYIGLLPGAEAQTLVDNDRISMTQSALVLENLISQFLYNQGSNKSGPAEGKGGL